MTDSAPTFLETADRIGCRLCRDALWADRRCNWLGWSLELDGDRWMPTFRALGSDLYDGTAGIALFLAHLHALTDDPIQKITARGALAQACDRLATAALDHKIGFYSGIAGIGYVLIEAAEILREEELRTRGIDLLVSIRDSSINECKLDVIDGSAGLIPVLVEMGRRFDRDELVDLAIQHGERLLSAASQSDDGWSWDTMHQSGQNHLTGYSHGVAGIACALMELSAVTGHEHFRSAALEGLRYERRHFDVEHGNWPDFRVADTGTVSPALQFSMAWCHGAPGIGLSRLRIAQLQQHDDQISDEIDAAIATTASALSVPIAFGHENFSLCHGRAGNADVLLVAADQLERVQFRETAEAVGREGIAQIEQNDMPWPCGIRDAGGSPNLMLGLAGIGYFYLRLHDSRSVPSVLLPSSMSADDAFRD